ncbi:MAG: hypothetical protein ACR2JH_02370 [Solirubrobacteraceae bacterium]
MADDEVARELNDPFASLLLRKGAFPTTVNEVLSALDAVTAQGDPLRRQMSFLVGEGSQIPWSSETAALDRGFRLAIARGTDSAIDVLVSSATRLLTADMDEDSRSKRSADSRAVLLCPRRAGAGEKRPAFLGPVF